MSKHRSPVTSALYSTKTSLQTYWTKSKALEAPPGPAHGRDSNQFNKGLYEQTEAEMGRDWAQQPKEREIKMTLGLGEHSHAGGLRSSPREGIRSTTLNMMSEKAPVIHQHVLPSSLLSDRKGTSSGQNDKLYSESKSR